MPVIGVKHIRTTKMEGDQERFPQTGDDHDEDQEGRCRWIKTSDRIRFSTSKSRPYAYTEAF